MMGEHNVNFKVGYVLTVKSMFIGPGTVTGSLRTDPENLIWAPPPPI